MPITRPKAHQIDFDKTNITDPLVRINSGQTTANDKDIGLVLERGSDTNVALIWDESADEFVLASTTEDGTTSGNVTISSYVNIRAGTFYGDGSGLTGVTNYTDSDVASYLSTNGYDTATNIVASITDSAPTTLDTLNELAAALGDDPNFATTTSTALGNRLRIDTAAQSLTGTQQTNALTNLGITATTTELNYTDGVTSNIQTQLDAKLASSSYTAADVLTKIKTVDGAGSGLDADLLDGQEGSYYQSALTALKTSTTFGGDVSGTYNAIVVANDSHTHQFDNLTNKTSGTGDYATSGDLVSGKGSGGVALTINDGYGNANVTWNHQNGVPEQNGNAARIEVNTDATSGAAMYFELKSGVTGGSAVQTTTIMTLTEGNITAGSGVVFSGTATTAQYADLAEKYLADEDYEPGTVLIIGGNAEVTACEKYKDKRLAGVVSTNPAYLMNNNLQGQHVVELALMGRVPCKVTGIINKGDLLTTSSIKGVATVHNSSDYVPGTIIGKALENYSGTKPGVIEILVGKV